MKNQLMKQAKKSFSLFLAVLMLMSCWVWVAPEKAEAAAPNSYDVVVTTGSDNKNACEVTHRIVFTHADNTTTEKNWANAQNEVAGDETFTLTKWPKKIYFQIGSKNVAKARITRITINGVEIFSGGYNLSATGGLVWESKDDWTLEAGGTQAGQTANWTAPKYTDSVTTLNGADHTLAVINSGINSTSTISIGSITDQYGVTYTGSITPSFTLRVDDGITLGSNATITGSGNSRTITIKPWFQTLYPGKQSAKLYIDWDVNSKTKSGTETINVTFPTYKATFHANGGKIGVDDTEQKDSIEYTGEKMNIGSFIGKAPAYATKTGFEFKGFYSTQYADATGKTASFDKSKKFVDDETIIPAATSGNGDTNWYAAWQALPITATFLTQDGQLIGTVEGRYNNYLTASNMYNGDAGLNAAVKASHTAGKVKFNTNNEPIYTDGATNYNFAGWKIIKAYSDSVMDKNEDTVLKGDVTFQAVYTKADAKTYTVSFKDGNGNVLSSKDGYKYRDYVTNVPANEPTKAQDDRYEYKFIGWAKDIGKNFYTVDEANKDENGAVIAYTHKDGAEFIVKGDATYVPVFRMVPREYKVTYTYTVDGGDTATTTIEGFHWHDAPTMPEIKDNYTAGGFRNYLIGWIKDNTITVPKQLNEFTVEGDLNLTAVYGNSEAAKYTINFYGKAEDGVTDIPLEESGIYEHNQTVEAPSVPQEIDTEDSLYTFEKWSPEISTSASGDADYYAIYTKKDYADIHFYNYDGTLLKEKIGNVDPDNLFVNDIIPEYDGADPVKEEDPIGTYKFIGWADSQGNTVVPGTDKLSGDTYLYAQFETTYKNYTVKFVNDVIDDKTGEKVVVSEKPYHYGDPITIPENPAKAPDVEYIYEFKAWSPDVSDVCYGDVTYTATYRRTPQYYTVTWFNDKKVVHTESNYQYGAKIQQAVIKDPVGYNAPETGKQWVLAYWVQCDVNGKDILVDGEQVHFVRGQRMGSEQLYFYPVFRQESNVLTVKFYKEDGTSWLGEAKVPYDAKLSDYDETFKAKAPKLSDETYHYVINNWVNVNGGATVITVKADVSVKAQYTAEAHDKKLYEIVAEPTCNVPGYAHYKCDAEECTSIDYNRPIEPVADEGKPTGQLYVGTDKWTLENYIAGIDYTDIKYISPSTQLIVNAEDTGSESEPWNPDALLSRGVGKIEYYVSEGDTIDPSTVLSNYWTEIYNFESLRTEALNVVLDEYKIDRRTYDGYISRGTPEEKMKKAEIDRAVDAYLSVYNANATGVVSNLNLVDGKEYVIYIKISDREGNGEVNVNYLSSGMLSFGSEAAKITVTGEGSGTKFCEKANIRIVDDSDNLKSVTLDGEEVSVYTNPGTTSANGTFVATFETTERGLHTVTVVDKHGNKTSKIFEIKGTHTNRNFTTAATCEEEGATYDLCTVCGKQDNVKIDPATGHNFTTNFIDKEATCVADGTRTYVCENNCGTKLVLKPTDSAETIAQASKLVDEEKVALTAEDLAHLKATGEHTYEKVKDADGNDTAELAWIVDKAATCTKEGSRHRDCIVCGHIDARVREVIPVDRTNGHKFYREKVTLEPTCTVEGKKTKTCRYCGYVELVENIDALGHTDGEYRIIKDATCEEDGSKILTCSVCGVNLGEEVEIPATGHAWKLKGAIHQGADGKWYQDYECKNDSTHTKSEEVEGYQPPVPATVTFVNGDATHATIKGFVGDEISASEITTKPVKAADKTYTYIFSHWADEEGNEVKFPIEVKGDATFKAVYTEKFVNYTITYYKEIEKKLSDGTVTTELQEFKKVGYLHNEEEVELADGPAKAETSLNKYVFAGWVNLADGTVYTDNVTINGADISLKAVYTDVLKKYAVTYAYSSNDIIHTYTVDAGSPAPDVFNDFDVTKKCDTKYHYEFKSWNRAAQLEKVESNIYTTPDFEAELHSFKAEDGGKIEVVTAATCFANAVNKYTCACGYTYTKEEPNTKRTHKMSDPITGEDGTVTRYCTYEDCDYEDSKMDTFTMEFFVNADDAKAIKTINYIPWGSSIDATRLPAAPKKDSSATTDYTFAGWYINGDETKTVVDVTSLEVKQNYKFVAYFEETTREYSVIFAYDAKNVIQKNVNVKAGSSVKFEGVKPAKACDINYHYTFNGWEGYEGTAHDITVTNVQSDLYILATFKGTKHTYTSFELSAATCTNGTGTRYYCDCNGNDKFDDKIDDKFVDYYYDQTGKPLPHNFKEIERREPSIYNDGYVKYECQTCHAVETETLKYNDNTMEIRVYVEHNGAPESGVKVEIRNEVDGSVVFATTNTNGYAIFAVDKDGIYSCYAAGNYIELVKDGAGLYGAYSYTDQASCTCACHRDNIWGAIFRFFHKIIKLFTGEFKCCKNPDPMYG